MVSESRNLLTQINHENPDLRPSHIEHAFVARDEQMMFAITVALVELSEHVSAIRKDIESLAAEHGAG